MQITVETNGTLIPGTTGDDTIEAYGANDTVDAGLGNDTLFLGGLLNKNDTILYHAGDGNDTIEPIHQNYFLSLTHPNTLLFGAGIKASDVDIEIVNVRFSDVVNTFGETYQANEDLMVTLPDNGSVFIPGFVSANVYTPRYGGISSVNYPPVPGVQKFQLQDDPTVVLSLHEKGTDEDDTLYDLTPVSGIHADIRLEGGAGNDTYYAGSMYNTATIADNSGNNTLEIPDSNNQVINLLSGNDQWINWQPGDIRNVISGTGNDLIVGDDNDNALWGKSGNDTLISAMGHDMLVGGAGNDLLRGGIGDTTYAFYGWSGIDTIQDSGGWDQVVFKAGVDSSSVAFFMDDSNNLQIYYHSANSDNQITVQNATSSGWLEHLQNSDGSFLSGSDIHHVIQDMSAYAASHGEALNSLQDVKNNPALMTIIGNAWHH